MTAPTNPRLLPVRPSEKRVRDSHWVLDIWGQSGLQLPGPGLSPGNTQKHHHHWEGQGQRICPHSRSRAAGCRSVLARATYTVQRRHQHRDICPAAGHARGQVGTPASPVPASGRLGTVTPTLRCFQKSARQEGGGWTEEARGVGGSGDTCPDACDLTALPSLGTKCSQTGTLCVPTATEGRAETSPATPSHTEPVTPGRGHELDPTDRDQATEGGPADAGPARPAGGGWGRGLLCGTGGGGDPGIRIGVFPSESTGHSGVCASLSPCSGLGDRQNRLCVRVCVCVVCVSVVCACMCGVHACVHV